jgi:hypothetical protein
VLCYCPAYASSSDRSAGLIALIWKVTITKNKTNIYFTINSVLMLLNTPSYVLCISSLQLQAVRNSFLLCSSVLYTRLRSISRSLKRITRLSSMPRSIICGILPPYSLYSFLTYYLDQVSNTRPAAWSYFGHRLPPATQMNN